MIKKAILAMGVSLALGCASIGVPRVPSLDCDDVIETERHGTVFYSCEQDTTETVLETFDLVGRVKQYGKTTFGFEETVNYRQYVNTGRQRPRMSYRLYVSPRNMVSLEPADEVFLLFSQEYRNEIEEPVMIWSRKDDLLDEQEYYRAHDYDTYRRALTNYSPGATITPDFIARNNEWLIRTVVHEDWHFNMIHVWGNGLDTDLEESVATIMGHAGSIGFTSINYGLNAAIYTEALNSLGKWSFFSETVNMTYNRLENLYAQNLPWEETKDAKAEILSLVEQRGFIPLNNAGVLGALPYTRLFPLAYDVYVTHPDAGELGRILMQCPDDEEKGIEFLRRARYMSANQRAVISFEDLPVNP
ncbi:MAG: aminopeptidase [Nanoarchaeota archaeon]